jgi:hypothetical protein
LQHNPARHKNKIASSKEVALFWLLFSGEAEKSNRRRA